MSYKGTKFEGMTYEAAVIVSHRIGSDFDNAAKVARSYAFDVASSTDYTEADAYEVIMAKAEKLAK